MSSIPKKAIFAVTSANDVMYPDGQRTGLFITEVSRQPGSDRPS